MTGGPDGTGSTVTATPSGVDSNSVWFLDSPGLDDNTSLVRDGWTIWYRRNRGWQARISRSRRRRRRRKRGRGLIQPSHIRRATRKIRQTHPPLESQRIGHETRIADHSFASATTPMPVSEGSKPLRFQSKKVGVAMLSHHSNLLLRLNNLKTQDSPVFWGRLPSLHHYSADFIPFTEFFLAKRRFLRIVRSRPVATIFARNQPNDANRRIDELYGPSEPTVETSAGFSRSFIP